MEGTTKGERMKTNIDRVYKTKEVAQRLEVSTAIVRYRIREGKLKARNVNPEGEKPQWRIRGEDILEYEKKYGRG